MTEFSFGDRVKSFSQPIPDKLASSFTNRIGTVVPSPYNGASKFDGHPDRVWVRLDDDFSPGTFSFFKDVLFILEASKSPKAELSNEDGAWNLL